MTPADETAAQLVRRDKRVLGETVSLFEDDRPAALAARREILEALDRAGADARARWVGVTGAPGVGKSSLIGRLALGLVAHDRAVAIVAVDPSSSLSGGALLGDRARVRLPPEEARLYFRSQASDLELGGLGRHTLAVGRLLERLFDLVILETVGVGQSETAVVGLVDLALLVVQPHAGDRLQLMKAGLLELVDRIVLNKADLGGASHDLATLRGQFADRVTSLSARTGKGVDDLVQLLALAPRRREPGERDARGFAAWVGAEHGRAGLELLASRGGGAAARVAAAGGLEAALLAFPFDFRAWQAD